MKSRRNNYIIGLPKVNLFGLNRPAAAIIISVAALVNFLGLHCYRGRIETGLPQAQAQDRLDEANNAPVPFGINNPFKYADSDNGSEKCLQNKNNSALTLGHDANGSPSYVERHIGLAVLKGCIPNGAGYMEDIKNIGVNIISQHFPRRYCGEDCAQKNGFSDYKDRPYFGLEEESHRNHEAAAQLYINGFNNYFWAAIAPASTKGYRGDIDIEAHQIIDKNIFAGNQRQRYLPNSPEGFAEWQKWLTAVFDYLDAHILRDENGNPIIINGKKQTAADKLLYIQLGNESDADYAKSVKKICAERFNVKQCNPKQIRETKKGICREKYGRECADKKEIKKGGSGNPRNPEHYYWNAYVKLIESSYAIIRKRAPKAKIAIGATGAGGVTIEGFQRPVLEYLAGKIDEDGNPVPAAQQRKKCPDKDNVIGAGCFVVYDYHDFSRYQDYRERKACRPRNCKDPYIEITRSPEYFRDLLDDTGFPDKKLVVQQGGTYTGYDSQADKIDEYQTEEDQAAYLVKRGCYLLSQGVEAMQFGAYIEHFGHKGTIHNWFTMMGLAYNGIPESAKSCDGQLPCPDPGRDVKKLSWFSQKKLIETLKGSNWEKITPLITLSESNAAFTYAYKFIKNDTTQNPVYAAWWDWWKDYPREEAKVEKCKSDHKGGHASMDKCINALDKDKMSKEITLNFDFAQGKIRITEAVPYTSVGQQAEVAGYGNAFHSYTQDVINQKATITLGKRPVYIEEISGAELPIVSIVQPEE